MDLELLDWLQQYTYPEEAHYADPAYARLGYSYFVRDLKNSATTRACIFATLHTDATLELMHQLRGAGLFRLCRQAGYGPQQPDSYREPSAAAGLAETRPLAGYLPRRKHPARGPGAPDDHAALHPQHE